MTYPFLVKRNNGKTLKNKTLPESEKRRHLPNFYQSKVSRVHCHLCMEDHLKFRFPSLIIHTPQLKLLARINSMVKLNLNGLTILCLDLYKAMKRF